MLHELEPLAGQTHDREVFQAIRAVVDRHSSGLYPAAELAIMAGVYAGGVHGMLAQMVTEGLATSAGEPTDPAKGNTPPRT